MIGLILVTHGDLALELKKAMEHVVGPQEQLVVINIGPEDDVEQRRDEIIEAVKEVDKGDGVILLTDMFGGTPSNLAISVMEMGKVEVIAGVNLPMLIKLSSIRSSMELDEAADEAQKAGVKYINIASKLLST